MAKKLIAILLALTVVVFAFAACGDTKGTETTTEATDEADVTTEAPVDETTAAPVDETTAAPVDETTAAAAETTAAAATTAAAETTAAAATTAAAETTAAAKAPQSKAEIIAYYNEVINKVKPGAKSITQNYAKISLAGPTTLPSSLNTVLKLLGGADKFLGDQLAKNSDLEKHTIDKSAFPVENESWSSKLTEADVKSATCVDNNGIYTITITTVADGKSATVKHGEGHAPKAFNVVLPGVVNDNIPGAAAGLVGTATMNYPSSTVKITVDSKTGQVKTALYDMYWTINFDKVGAILPFLTSTSYDIAW
ncbi:MAG: hypothetical protein IK080_08450 [Clostridia bacterium]|nr:hypothetical protein [Clostridia bacterium]